MSGRPRQAKFVEEYLIDANGKQAALRAGYAASGAKETAARLLTNDNVKEALRKARAARAGRTDGRPPADGSDFSPKVRESSAAIF